MKRSTLKYKIFGFKPLLYSWCWAKATTRVIRQRAMMTRIYHSQSTTQNN